MLQRLNINAENTPVRAFTLYVTFTPVWLVGTEKYILQYKSQVFYGERKRILSFNESLYSHIHKVMEEH